MLRPRGRRVPSTFRGSKEARVPGVVEGVEGDGGQSGQASVRTWALLGTRWQHLGQFLAESDEET